MIAAELLPGIEIQFVQAPAHAQPLARRQPRRGTTEHQFTPPLSQRAWRCGQIQAGQIAIFGPVAALTTGQGHAPAGITRLLRRLAERGW